MDDTIIGKINFTKLSGSGNDFICLDNRMGKFDSLLNCTRRSSHFVRSLCTRATGIGADGIIFACKPEADGVADIAARLFDPDGSEVELCGNGTACFAHWVRENKWVDDGKVRILTPAGIVLGKKVDGDYIRVCLPFPTDIRRGGKLKIAGDEVDYGHMIIGVPHVVVFVKNLADVDVKSLGAEIRNHDQFAPRGANVNFVQVLSPGNIAVRTFEFGVEGETLACGTGSAAAAIMSAIEMNWDRRFTGGEEPVNIRSRSGKILRVYFTMNEAGEIIELCLDTEVKLVFNGLLHEDQATLATNPANINPC